MSTKKKTEISVENEKTKKERRALEKAVDLVVDLYKPALKELEKY